MAAAASSMALAEANWSPADVEYVIFATLSPDHHFPGSGVRLQHMLGLGQVGALDVRTQCSGFLYALEIGNALIRSGKYSRILVVGAEIHSHTLEVPETNPDVAILFGDGAAAMALEASREEGIIESSIHSDGSGASALQLEIFDISKRPYLTVQDVVNRRHIPVMDGTRIFLRAVKEMTAVAEFIVRKCGKTLDDVDLVIPHQANLRINETVRKRLHLSPEKVFNNIQTRGNTTAASIPLAMAEARSAGALRRGQLVLLVAFGSGFTWGAVLLRF